MYCARWIPAYLRCTQGSILLHLIYICFLTCIYLWQILQIPTCLRVVVGPVLVSTSPVQTATAIMDTYGRNGRWQLLRKYGCPEKFTTIKESLHTGMMVIVKDGEEVPTTFSILNGVKQGYVLAPTLLSIFIIISNALQRQGRRTSILMTLH